MSNAGSWSVRRIGGMAAAFAVATLVIVGQVVEGDTWLLSTTALTAVVAVGFTIMGALVLGNMPGHPVGRLMLAAGGRRAWPSWRRAGPTGCRWHG